MEQVLTTIANHINDYRYFHLNQPPPPAVKAMIVEHDRVHMYFYPIIRKMFADGLARPIINDFFIEWKNPKRARWTGISTGTDNLKGITFYLKHDDFKDKKTGLVDGHWHEYSFFHRLSEIYDVRVYAKNKSRGDIHPFTYAKLTLFEKPPSDTFENYQNTPPYLLNATRDYLITNTPKKAWKKFPGYIARLCTYERQSDNQVYPTSWIYYKPREGWQVDGYLFKNDEWYDQTLHNAYKALWTNKQNNTMIFEILKMSHIARLPGDNYEEKEIYLKQYLIDAKIEDEDSSEIP